MVYLGGKGKNNASRSNQTTHFGIMGGLAPSTNVAQGVKRFRLRRARNKQTIPLMPIPGLQYMKEKDILSKNPAGSGGVGLSKVLVDRAMGPCNCGAAPDAEVDEPFAPRTGCTGTTFFASDPPEKVRFSHTGKEEDFSIFELEGNSLFRGQLRYRSEHNKDNYLFWYICKQASGEKGWYPRGTGLPESLHGVVGEDGTVDWGADNAELFSCSDPCTVTIAGGCTSKIDWDRPPYVLFFGPDEQGNYEEFVLELDGGDEKIWLQTGVPKGLSQKVLLWKFCNEEEDDWSLCLGTVDGCPGPTGNAMATGSTTECGKVVWNEPYRLYHLYHCPTNLEPCSDRCKKAKCANDCLGTNDTCYEYPDCSKHPGFCQCPPCTFKGWGGSTEPPEFVRVQVTVEKGGRTRWHQMGPIALKGDGSASWSNENEGSSLHRSVPWGDQDRQDLTWTLILGDGEDSHEATQQVYTGAPYISPDLSWPTLSFALIEACDQE